MFPPVLILSLLVGLEQVSFQALAAACLPHLWSAFVVESLSDVQPFVTLWTRSPPGSSVHGISRQEYWSRLQFPSQGVFPTQGSNLHLLHWQAGFTTEPVTLLMHFILDGGLSRLWPYNWETARIHWVYHTYCTLTHVYMHTSERKFQRTERKNLIRSQLLPEL